MALWQVGPTRTYHHLQEIMSNINSGPLLVADGDRIEIDYAAGFVYDTASWVKRADITIVGVGGANASEKPKIKGDNITLAGFGKGIIYQDSPGLTIENLELYNASTAGEAAVRLATDDGYTANGLTVRNCYIHHCDDGVLGGVGITGDVLIEDCEFAFTGIGDAGGGQSHGVYITTSGTLTVRGCYFHHHKNGMLLKSKSRTTFIIANRLHDETFVDPFGSSQQVDIAWGGLVFMIGNSLHKNAEAGNSGTMVKNNSNAQQANIVETTTLVEATASGGPWEALWSGNGGTALVDGQGWFPKNFYAINNTFVNDDTALQDVFINDPYFGVFPNNNYQIQNNIFIGADDLHPVTISSTENYFAVSVAADFFWDLATRDFRLRRTATGVLNQDSLSPTTGNGQSLIPTLLFDNDAMVGTVARAVNGALDRGMFEVPVPSVDSIGFNEFVEVFSPARDRWTCHQYVHVDPLRTDMPNPVGRSYSGMEYGGDGTLWYFGGGDQSHYGNDVEIFDTRTHVWEQQYVPEMNPAVIPPQEDPGPVLSPLGRPWGYFHTYQHSVYDPRNGGGAVCLMSQSKLYKYVIATKAWSVLGANGLSGPIETFAMIFDSLLQKLIAIGGTQHKVVQYNDDGTYTDLAETPTAFNGHEIYLAYDDLRQYVLVNTLSAGGVAGLWYKFDATNTWTQLTGGPTSSNNSLWYDPVSQLIVIFAYDPPTGAFRVWTFDGTTFTQLPLGPLPFQQGVINNLALGAWNPLRYDPVRSCFWFLWAVDAGPGSFGGGTGGDSIGAVRTFAYRLASPAGVAAPGVSGPSVSTLVPPSGQPGQAFTVTINGSGFDPAASVTFGAGITVGLTTVFSPARIDAAITIDPGASLGVRTVTVQNPTGSALGTFTVGGPPLAATHSQSTQDRVGIENQTTPNGTPDWKISLTNLQAQAITAVHITNAASGGIWHRPFNTPNWIIDLDRVGLATTADLYFEPFLALSPFVVTVTYADASTAAATSTPGFVSRQVATGLTVAVV